MKESTSVRLKRLMEERGLKQVDIINKCEPYCKKYSVKLTKNYLSQYVSGKVEPGQHTLSVLSMALNVSEAWLMGYDVPKKRNLMPPLSENPVLRAIYSDPNYKDSDIADEFVNKKLIEALNLETIDIEMIMEFKKLNNEGKREAINRIVELTFVPKYKEDKHE
jgi:transcriptional regulator with XRE-family HTH domain